MAKFTHCKKDGTENTLVSVFADTLDYVKQNDLAHSVTTKHTFKNIRIHDNFSSLKNVSVINTDTVTAGVSLSKSGKTAVLNMASYKKPGGGVINGARAQEESLFRCSNLFDSISKDHYPLKPDECLYTENSSFFKNFKYEYIEKVELDVITIAAINMNGKRMNSEIYHLFTKNKIRLMLSVAHLNKVENLVLGAFGCGVFKNNPEYIARMFKHALTKEGYASKFKNICFAIINDHNSVGSNYEVFSKMLAI